VCVCVCVFVCVCICVCVCVSYRRVLADSVAVSVWRATHTASGKSGQDAHATQAMDLRQRQQEGELVPQQQQEEQQWEPHAAQQEFGMGCAEGYDEWGVDELAQVRRGRGSMRF
jgi:hypothetical protein